MRTSQCPLASFRTIGSPKMNETVLQDLLCLSELLCLVRMTLELLWYTWCLRIPEQLLLSLQSRAPKLSRGKYQNGLFQLFLLSLKIVESRNNATSFPPEVNRLE